MIILHCCKVRKTTFLKINTNGDKVILMICLSMISLLLYQITICFNRFSKKPMTTLVEIQQPNTYKLPKLIFCPFRDALRRLFEISDLTLQNLCKPENDCEDHRSFPLNLLELNFTEIWSRSNLTVSLQDNKCQFAVNNTACENNQLQQTNLMSIEDGSSLFMLHGKCLRIAQADDYYFTKFSRDFAFIINKGFSKIGVTFAFDESIDSIFYEMPQETMLAFLGTTITITNIKKLNRLNIKTNPCVSKKEATTCIEECLNDELKKLSICQLPSFGNNIGVRPCASITEMLIDLTTFTNWLDNEAPKRFCKCPRQCKQILITMKYDLSERPLRLTSSQQLQIKIAQKYNNMEVITEQFVYEFSQFIHDIGCYIMFVIILSLTLIKRIIKIGKKQAPDFLGTRFKKQLKKRKTSTNQIIHVIPTQ